MVGHFDYGFIYVATWPGVVKIGITMNPESRLKAFGAKARMVQVWHHAYPQDIEMLCVDEWAHRDRHCRERFHDATPEEAVALVERMIKAYRKGKRPGNKQDRHRRRLTEKRIKAAAEREKRMDARVAHLK